MKKVLSVLLVFVMLLSMSVTTFAAEPNTVQPSYETSATMDDVLALEPFVIRNQDGTLSLDGEAAQASGKNASAIEALNQHFSVLNTQIQSGEIATDEDLNIINGEHLIRSHRCSTDANSGVTIAEPQTNWTVNQQSRPSNLNTTYQNTYNATYGTNIVVGSDVGVEVHHVRPLKYGGSNNMSNLVHIDKSFHSKITGWFAGY